MRVVLLSLVAACGFSKRQPPYVDDPVTDASLIDVPVTMIDACTSYSNQVNTCTVPVGGDGAIALTGTNTYSTESHVLRRGSTVIPVAHATVQTPTGTIDVIYARTFSLAAGATLEATGPLPLAIVASETMQIDGTLDLVGPGAGSRSDAICMASVGLAGADSNGGAGGGGGGAFQGDGGKGGDGNSGAVNAGTGGAKITLPAGLVGGCDGGAGGDAQANGPEAGDGGGAILLAAGTSITIGGVVNAGGGRGRAGGCTNCGGSGGGSGGMIILEADAVSIAGVLAANGGAGGEGSNGVDGAPGQASASAATAGAGADSNGGDGAIGSSREELDGEDTADEQSEGGGGGGGGAGFIAIRAMTVNVTGTVSPPHVPWP